jgi:cytochrome P450
MTHPTQPPGPKGADLFRNLLAYHFQPIRLLTRLAREYGDLVHFVNVPGANAYLVNHPDYIEEILATRQWNFVPYRVRALRQAQFQGVFTAQGYLHERQRRLLTPIFYKEDVEDIGCVAVEYAARLREGWREGQTLEVQRLMLRTALDITAETLFGPEFRAEAELGDAGLAVSEYLSGRITHPFAQATDLLPGLPSNRRFAHAIATMDRYIYRKIADRRNGDQPPRDVLTLMARARDTADGSKMSDRQLRDEVVTAYTTGNGSMSSALTWTWYALSQNPEVEARVHAEVDALGDRLPAARDLPRLTYTRMVFEESMRMYPPVWVQARYVVNDFPLDGYLLPAGSTIVLSQFVTHHDRRFHEFPYRFDPERWTPEARAARHRFSYFPFGAGPRDCIPENFAWVEMLLFVATVAQRWRLRLVPDYRVVFRPRVNLRVQGGLPMYLEPRRPAPATG